MESNFFALFFIMFLTATSFAVERDYRFEKAHDHLIFMPQKNQTVYSMLLALGIHPNDHSVLMKQVSVHNPEIKDINLIFEGRPLVLPLSLLVKYNADLSKVKTSRLPAAANAPTSEPLLINKSESESYKDNYGLVLQFSVIESQELSDTSTAQLESNPAYGFRFKRSFSSENNFNFKYYRESFQKASGKNLNNAKSDTIELSYGYFLNEYTIGKTHLYLGLRQKNFLLAYDANTLEIRKANLPNLAFAFKSSPLRIFNFRIDTELQLQYNFSSTVGNVSAEESLTYLLGLDLSFNALPNFNASTVYRLESSKTQVHTQEQETLFFFLNYHP